MYRSFYEKEAINSGWSVRELKRQIESSLFERLLLSRGDANAVFERAIVEFQMRMLITMSGRKQKKNQYGEVYGWSSTVFTTVEDFWEKRGLILPDLDPKESFEKIKEQVLRLNPEAQKKKIEKFVRG